MYKQFKNEYHYKLNIPVEFKPSIIEDSNFRCHYPIELINQEFKDWLKSFNIGIFLPEQFLLDPNNVSKHIIHKDGAYLFNFIKLNFVFCDTPSTMNWYKLLPGKELKNVNSSGGTPYLISNADDTELVYSAQVGQPSLVNVSHLHDVSTVQSKRYCFSFVLTKLKDGEPIRGDQAFLSWQEGEEIFDEYIIGG